MARANHTPICQDTGSLLFTVRHPVGLDVIAFRRAIEEATQKATEEVLLRPNAVDPLTGKNTRTNLGDDAPHVTFHAWEKPDVRVELTLKGGGSENVGAQYKLPDAALGAGRDLKGIRKCVLDAVYKAQGMGCAPGIIGVGIGGDRATSYLLSKEQFQRRLGSANPDPALDQFEKELYADLNKLGIGPMGFGGKTTVLGVFAARQHRHPATFFVAVSYMCWACRRKAMTLRNGEAIYDPA
jgi:fumarate hydratase class I